MTGALLRRQPREDRDTWGKCHVTSKAEIDITHLQVKECQSWPANHQQLGRRLEFFESTWHCFLISPGSSLLLPCIFHIHMLALLLLVAWEQVLLSLLLMVTSLGCLWTLPLSRASVYGCTGGSLHKDPWSGGQVGLKSSLRCACQAVYAGGRSQSYRGLHLKFFMKMLGSPVLLLKLAVLCLFCALGPQGLQWPLWTPPLAQHSPISVSAFPQDPPQYSHWPSRAFRMFLW